MAEIRRIRESMDQTLTEFLGERASKDGPATLLDLVPHVSSVEAREVRIHLNRVDLIKHQILKSNDQNKRFIQETLDFLKDTVSLLISPDQKAPVYAKEGKKVSSPSATSWVSREV